MRNKPTLWILLAVMGLSGLASSLFEIVKIVAISAALMSVAEPTASTLPPDLSIPATILVNALG